MRPSTAQPDLSLVATPSSVPLAERVARELGISLEHLRSVRFANENLEVRALGLAAADRDVVLCQTFSSAVSDRLLELLLGLRALRSTGPRRLTALLPYFPYARSDRPESPGEPVAARLIADLVERAGADRVISMDLHAPQIAGFFRIPLIELSAREVLLAGVRAWQLADPVVVSPDLGGAKRAAAFAAALAAPLALVSKRRTEAGVASSDLMGEVAGCDALLIDDEIATGATLVSATELLLARGAREVRVAATHPVFAGEGLARLEAAPIARILTTDTLPGTAEPSSKLEIVSVAPILASALGGASSPKPPRA